MDFILGYLYVKILELGKNEIYLSTNVASISNSVMNI